jgi:hypothetical protein
MGFKFYFFALKNRNYFFNRHNCELRHSYTQMLWITLWIMCFFSALIAVFTGFHLNCLQTRQLYITYCFQ